MLEVFMKAQKIWVWAQGKGSTKEALDALGDLLKMAAAMMPESPESLPLSLPKGLDFEKILQLLQLLRGFFGK